MLELLAQISQLSLSLQSLTETSVIIDECGPKSTSQIVHPVNKVIELQNPDLNQLLDELVSSGCPKATADELVSVHAKRCAELAQHYQEIHSNICQSLSPAMIALEDIDYTGSELSSLAFTKLARPRKLQQLYHRTTMSWSKDLLRSVRVWLASNERNGCTSTRSQNKFNQVLKTISHCLALITYVLMQEFVPVLEKIFETSPFPTLAIKKALAKSSGMTTRQISVWVSYQLKTYYIMCLYFYVVVSKSTFSYEKGRRE